MGLILSSTKQGKYKFLAILFKYLFILTEYLYIIFGKTFNNFNDRGIGNPFVSL